ncbi:urokinase plasminogen activator surface receptor isoform X2 [Meriones unguiculatus]|uniref:urokinase plasminogen activator surface receptor isoform X2 n=1 Tax=Meriones unguiculatus TaxID=10047 RepID=UPI00293ED1CB|nr:urokinase plasminogen activator surface receptor isoform X2 [Meriones unguiculatus]
MSAFEASSAYVVRPFQKYLIKCFNKGGKGRGCGRGYSPKGSSGAGLWDMLAITSLALELGFSWSAGEPGWGSRGELRPWRERRESADGRGTGGWSSTPPGVTNGPFGWAGLKRMAGAARLSSGRTGGRGRRMAVSLSRPGPAVCAVREQPELPGGGVCAGAGALQDHGAAGMAREKTNRTMSYRVGSKIVSLAETVCPGDLCNRPRPRVRGPAFPRGRYLECVSCTSLDQSCERGREQSLRCRDPGEQCIEVVTLQSGDRRANDQNYTRGCGRLPGCPGVSGFHGGRALHLLKCCNRTQCNGGPALGLQDLPPNGIRCYGCDGHECSSSDPALIDCRGPMTRCLEATGVDAQENRSLTVRGCATASWCQGSHAADAFLLSRLRVSCCEGSGCNRPSGGGAGPARLGLSACLLAVLLALAA